MYSPQRGWPFVEKMDEDLSWSRERLNQSL
jgi:hypothetical protein